MLLSFMALEVLKVEAIANLLRWEQQKAEQNLSLTNLRKHLPVLLQVKMD